jgi:hypothetical protein
VTGALEPPAAHPLQSDAQYPFELDWVAYGQRKPPVLQPAQFRGTHRSWQHAPPQLAALHENWGDASVTASGVLDSASSALLPSPAVAFESLASASFDPSPSVPMLQENARLSQPRAKTVNGRPRRQRMSKA